MAQPKTEAYQGKEFPLFPEITVKLSGTDGNVFAIMGAVRKGLHYGKAGQEAIDAFVEESEAGDYDHTIQTAMRTLMRRGDRQLADG